MAVAAAAAGIVAVVVEPVDQRQLSVAVAAGGPVVAADEPAARSQVSAG